MKNWVIGFSCFLATSLAFSQTEEEKKGSKVTEYKIDYLTKKIVLTPDQAKQFWPVYTDYDKERREIRLSARDIKRSENEKLSEDQLKENLKKMADLKQKEAGVEKKYLDKFLKVVGPQQVSEMQKAEREFNREMIQIIHDRREARHNLQQQHHEKRHEHTQTQREKSVEHLHEHRQNLHEAKPKN